MVESPGFELFLAWIAPCLPGLAQPRYERASLASPAVAHAFDPPPPVASRAPAAEVACFVDDDGSGVFCFNGGVAAPVDSGASHDVSGVTWPCGSGSGKERRWLAAN